MNSPNNQTYPLPFVICLMGPTGAGKTALAVDLVQRFPCDIISVDSAMVYQGMDIGTAKPEREILALAPHQLIDICDPADAYSAGRFREDALRAIQSSHANGRVPLLVGGTMMYFRALQQGLAEMPVADPLLRESLEARVKSEGLAALHAYLHRVDPLAASRININDSQRIQRAIEVYEASGKTITEWQQTQTTPLAGYDVVNIALLPEDRALLHKRIAERFHEMLAMGLIDEVKALYQRGDLSVDLPSIRSVGYRQAWDYLSGNISKDEMTELAIIATRQLAKRQITWLRSWPELSSFVAESTSILTDVMGYLQNKMKKFTDS